MNNFELNIGRACNSRCVFCVSRHASAAEKAWLPLEKAREEILRAREAGCRSLGFLGGEPTAYPHLVPLIRYGKELGFERVALGTNGIRLSDPDFAAELIAAGVTRFGISIHSHRAEVEDGLTRTRGSFARKVAGIGILLQHKNAGRIPDNVSVNPVLHSRNLDQLGELVGFFSGLGIDDIRFNTYRPIDHGDVDRDLCPRFSEAMPKVIELIAHNEQDLGLHLTFGDFPYCVWPWAFLANPYLVRRYVGEQHDLPTSVAIYADGQSDHGEGDGVARFDWSEAKRTHLKAKEEVCAGCAWDSRCEGFWKHYLDIHTASEVKPPTGVYPPD